MKTNYRPRNRLDYSRVRIVLAVLIVLGVGLVFAVSKFEISTSAIFSSKVELEEEIRILYREVSALESEIQRLIAPEVVNGLVAGVLERPPENQYDLLTLSKGALDGVVAGSSVYAQGYLIGVVIDVGEDRSTVGLYSSPGTRHDVIFERDSIPAVTYGVGLGNFTVEFLKEVEVKMGDKVWSASPRAPLAVVGEINRGPTDSSQEVLARSPINYSELNYVLVSR